MKRNKSKQSAPKRFGFLIGRPKAEMQGTRTAAKKKQDKGPERQPKEIGGHV